MNRYQKKRVYLSIERTIKYTLWQIYYQRQKGYGLPATHFSTTVRLKHYLSIYFNQIDESFDFQCLGMCLFFEYTTLMGPGKAAPTTR
jgi:hypothetical protein